MKVLEMGKKHVAEAVTTTCTRCDSVFRFLLGKGDPRVGRKKYNCDSAKEWATYVCPVCGKHSYAEWRSPYFPEEVNATLEEIVLEKEDLEEIKGFSEIQLSEDDLDWIERGAWKI